MPFPAQELAPLYRFALLLSADEAAARQAVVSAISACAAHLESYRTPASRIACLLHHVREQCKKSSRRNAAASVPVAATHGSDADAAGSACETSADGIPALAQTISAMPEPQRSALALFYLNLLPAREIAALLKLTLEDLADALEKGREVLRQHNVHGRHPAARLHEKTTGPISG